MDRIALMDPLQLALVGGGCLTLIILLMLIFSIGAARRGARAAEPLAAALAELGGAVRSLDQGQHQLAGGLKHVSEAQAAAQARMIETMERRLEAVQKSMGESLHGTSQKTTRSLTELQERLSVIDKAQTNIEKLSGDVLSLQDILSNKQARGAFGEIQLSEIVSKALPPDAYAFQATLSNGKRADCLIHLPNPPGPIVIDAKFPLEAYEALRAAQTERARLEAARAFRTAVQTHIRAIAERYIVPEETADGALMFLPSEAVYAELHSSFGDVVREGFARRVWIVSPTTCMATLNTMRAILKDSRMREQAGAIRRELSLLTKDMDRLAERVGSLDRHFEQARQDVEKIKISASKAGSRAEKLESFEFDEAAPALAPAKAAATQGP
ncbi:MAG: DNA recombination protein RmuC [Paracoccaceae bacterium]